MYYLLTTDCDQFTIINFSTCCWTNSATSGPVEETFRQANIRGITRVDTYDRVNDDALLMHQYSTPHEFCEALTNNPDYVDADVVTSTNSLSFADFKKSNPELFI